MSQPPKIWFAKAYCESVHRQRIFSIPRSCIFNSIKKTYRLRLEEGCHQELRFRRPRISPQSTVLSGLCSSKGFHKRTVPFWSALPEASVRPSGENATAITNSLWRAGRLARHRLSFASMSQSRTVRSSLADARIFPFGEKQTERMKLLCPSKTVCKLQLATFHNCTFELILPVARY
jgi:hypothetical protein